MTARSSPQQSSSPVGTGPLPTNTSSNPQQMPECAGRRLPSTQTKLSSAPLSPHPLPRPPRPDRRARRRPGATPEQNAVDPVTYALVLDALDHPGPAKPAPIPLGVCLQQYQPGVDPANPENYLTPLRLLPGFTGLLPGVNVVGAPEVAQEPPLRCYVTVAGCPPSTRSTGRAAVVDAGRAARTGRAGRVSAARNGRWHCAARGAHCPQRAVALRRSRCSRSSC